MNQSIFWLISFFVWSVGWWVCFTASQLLLGYFCCDYYFFFLQLHDYNFLSLSNNKHLFVSSQMVSSIPIYNHSYASSYIVSSILFYIKNTVQ